MTTPSDIFGIRVGCVDWNTTASYIVYIGVVGVACFSTF